MNPTSRVPSRVSGSAVLFLLLITPAIIFPKVLVAQGARPSQIEPRSGQEKDNAELREQWFRRGRSAPVGESAAELRYRAHRQKLYLRGLRRQQASAAGLSQAASGFSPAAPAVPMSWSPLGPAPLASDASGQGLQDYGPVAGRATAVMVDPADTTGNTVYVGGAYGGLWRSQNAASGSYGNASGVTWTPLTDDQPTLAIGSIAIQPGNVNASTHLSRTILLGTGEANDAADSYYGLGILRSTDEGRTWNLITSADNGAHPFLGMAAGKIAFSSTSGKTNVVVAGFGSSAPGEFEGADLGSPTTHGLYSSNDSGATWHLASVRDQGGALIVPSSARAVVYNALTQTFYASIRRHGIYSSTNGVNWTRLATQPDSAGSGLNNATNCPSFSNSINCPIVRGEFAVVAGRKEMYVWYMDVNGAVEIDKGIWKTLDGGTTWTPLSTTGIDCQTEPGCGVEQGAYNLTLAAVPSGSSATDVYAGAINLFKCSLNTVNNPTCAANPFINLTHVYGCSTLAAASHVHPDQHGIDYMLANGKSVMYFANDGGIYRALDGFTGLASGSCPPGQTSNQFDSLNQNIGSLTQFVAFSNHPSDPKVLLGGTQDNGSPATTSATLSTAWLNVNNGDGGYNAIDPTSPNSWFTAHPDVGGGTLEIDHCSLGANCHAQDFTNGVVITSAQLQGDDGAFYFPYLLDPQASTQILVGTCRVWRGPALGSGTFTALSSNFDTGTATVCSGSELNQVTALAAGGAKDSSGYSKVVYATTLGAGPYGPGGNVFVTTNAGASAMQNVTGNINPSGYTISGVALDTSDSTGQTAYVTIMGFHVAHVFKTSNAGQSWSDFSGSGLGALPDSPANAVVIAPGANPNSGVVFVATDTGVYSSATNAPSWTEVGPAASPGATGFLPNTTVVALGLFRAGGQTLLRAATHGRGLWQMLVSLVPDFQTFISNSPLTIYPGQSASFGGTISAAFGYSSSIALSCISASTQAPPGCTPSPASVTPTSNGIPFTVSTSSIASVNDYSFNLHQVGTDTNTTTHDLPLVLHVVDFGLTAPSPSSVPVPRGTTSGVISLQATAAGSFSGTVNLTCSGLPAGATCSFSPSAAVRPTATSPLNIALAVDVAASTNAGSYNVTIAGNVSGAPAAKTQSFTLVVQLNPDFVFSAPAAFPIVKAGHNGTGQIRISSIDAFSGSVNLTCSFPTTTCSVNPNSVSSFPANPNVTVDGTGLVGPYQMTVTGTSGSKVHTINIPFNVGSFSIAVIAPPGPVIPGQSTKATLDLTPSFGYTGIVALSCNVTTIPGAVCTLSTSTPINITGANATQFDVAIDVPGTASPGNYSASVTGTDQTGAPAASAVLTVPVIPFQFVGGTTPQNVASGQPATYNLSITPVGGNFQQPVLFPCSNLPPHASCAFTPSELPAGAGATAVSLTISTLESSPSARASTSSLRIFAFWLGTVGVVLGTKRRSIRIVILRLCLLPLVIFSLLVLLSCGGGNGGGGNPPTLPPLPVSVSISPTSAFVRTSARQQFTVTMSPSNSPVSWDVNGTMGGNAAMGTIDPSGLYTAPASLPSVPVIVRVSSQADPSKAAVAGVVVQAPTPPGAYDVTVIATQGSGSAALSRLLTVHLTVK